MLLIENIVVSARRISGSISKYIARDREKNISLISSIRCSMSAETMDGAQAY